MSETMKFQCHIKISDKNLKNFKKESAKLQFMGKTATIDNNGEAIFDCEISQKDICKSFPIKIHSEIYTIIGTGQCHPMSHRNNANPFSLSLDKESVIKSIEISKEKEQSNTNPKEHIAIYTAKVQKPSDSNVDSQNNNPNMIYLRVNLTSGVLKRDIEWAYYVKDKNESLWDSSKINKDNLNKFSSLQSFESILERNMQIRFDINAKFKYTIKENNAQKEIEDYLQDNKQLVIFAYKNNPAYKVGDNITHTTLNISSSPILEINYNTITILHKDIKKSFDIDISPKLICNMQNDKIYTLEFNIQNDYLTLKTNNNKLYKIYKAQDTNNITENNNADSIYLKDNHSFDEIKNTLKLTKENANVYVLTKWQITLLMLQEVFEYTKASNENKQRMDTILTEIANELNRIKDDEPMYVHYHLDSRARLEHFFAQCCVEVGGSAFRLEEDLNYSAVGLMQTYSYYRANKERIKEALNDGSMSNESKYNIVHILNYKINNNKNRKAIKEKMIDSIQALALEYINGLIAKRVSKMANKANITTKLAKSKIVFDKDKNYTPIELIETFQEYENSIEEAFQDGAVDKEEYHIIVYDISENKNIDSQGNKAFRIIAQKVFNDIAMKIVDKNAKQAIIANKVYGKGKNSAYNPNLADQTQGDGWRYKGRGLIHLTWKENYEQMGIYATKQSWIDDKDEFVNNPLLLSTNAKIALVSSICFWNKNQHNSSSNANYNVYFKNKYCYEIADDSTKTDDEKTNAITYIVNRETNSYLKRAEAYRSIKKVNIFNDFYDVYTKE